MNKIYTVAIIGAGGRGGEVYGSYIHDYMKDKFKVVSICDINPERLDKYKNLFNIEDKNAFLDEKDFFKEKRADLLIVSTQDRTHTIFAMKALKLGYDILLEKPISDNEEELRKLLKLKNETGRKVMVCHVLRYTTFIRKMKKLLDSGSIGSLVSIDHTENVMYYHQAHSYVRGNWRRRDETTPMIMAKCCHDLDIIQYFASSKAKTVSSIGDLRFFKKENQPAGASNRCTICKYIDECPYSAKKIYIEKFMDAGCPPILWPMSTITDALPLTVDAIRDAIENGPYGRCVFDCDNDVVDNQTTIIRFENGITATLKMEAFTKEGGRDIRLFGTHGEIVLNERDGWIEERIFGKETNRYLIKDIEDELGSTEGGGHGGGDRRMLKTLYSVLSSDSEAFDTSLEASIESHYMALAAEESRLLGGEMVKIEKYR